MLQSNITMQVHEFRQILISRLGVSYDAAVWDDSCHVSVGTIFDIKNFLLMTLSHFSEMLVTFWKIEFDFVA